MISELEMQYIEEKVTSGTLDAIAAHRVLMALKTQQREIRQLNSQLSNCQRKCRGIDK